MKLAGISTVLLLFVAACASPGGKENVATLDSTTALVDTASIIVENDEAGERQQGFGLMHNPEKDSVWSKPVSFYINDSNCSGTAIKFYYGLFRPSDNDSTDELLKQVVTTNTKLRPFYRWCLDRTIQVSDGALAEHVGIPARRYAEQFPEEFFDYMDTDTSGTKYDQWVEAISYSGFDDIDDYTKPAEIRARLIAAMLQHCHNCGKQLQNRIAKFATACFK